MLQFIMLTLVIGLFCTGFCFIRAGFSPSSAQDIVAEVVATGVLFVIGSMFISLAIYIIDNTLHWWF